MYIKIYIKIYIMIALDKLTGNHVRMSDLEFVSSQQTTPLRFVFYCTDAKWEEIKNPKPVEEIETVKPYDFRKTDKKKK